MPSRFDEFWALYPRRVGKIAARKTYDAALKIASHDEIMEGVQRYLKAKPVYADWCHPATWLCQGRWMDEPDAKPVNGPVQYTPELLASIASTAKRPWCEIGRYPREVLELCVTADLLTRDEMEAVL